MKLERLLQIISIFSPIYITSWLSPNAECMKKTLIFDNVNMDIINISESISEAASRISEESKHADSNIVNETINIGNNFSAIILPAPQSGMNDMYNRIHTQLNLQCEDLEYNMANQQDFFENIEARYNETIATYAQYRGDIQELRIIFGQFRQRIEDIRAENLAVIEASAHMNWILLGGLGVLGLVALGGYFVLSRNISASQTILDAAVVALKKLTDAQSNQLMPHRNINDRYLMVYGAMMTMLTYFRSRR